VLDCAAVVDDEEDIGCDFCALVEKSALRCCC